MKNIPEMQNKRNRYNEKVEKKKHHYMRLCHMLLYHCDNAKIGLIESSVNTAEEQRSALKANCMAKTYEGSEEERQDWTGPCHAIITAVVNK